MFNSNDMPDKIPGCEIFLESVSQPLREKHWPLYVDVATEMRETTDLDTINKLSNLAREHVDAMYAKEGYFWDPYVKVSLAYQIGLIWRNLDLDEDNFLHEEGLKVLLERIRSARIGEDAIKSNPIEEILRIAYRNVSSVAILENLAKEARDWNKPLTSKELKYVVDKKSHLIDLINSALEKGEPLLVNWQ